MNKRIYYLDFLKVFACIGVIMIHVAMHNIDKVLVYGYQYKVLNLYASISRFAVPIFVMVSGANMLNYDKECSFKKLYGKYILHMGIAFVFWSLFYNLCFSSRLSFNGFVHDNYHLWYLEMLIGLYIITPIIKESFKSMKNARYFLIIGAIFTFLIPSVFTIMKDFDLFIDVEKDLYFLNYRMFFYFPLGYTFYYVLGHYLNNISISKVKEYVIYVLGAFGFLFTMLMSYIVSNYKLNVMDTYYQPLTIGPSLMSIAVFVFFKKHLNIRLSDKIGHTVILLSQMTMGIYLIHPFFVDKFDIDTLMFNPLFLVPIFVVLLFFVSLVITFVLKKIPIIKKYLV